MIVLIRSYTPDIQEIVIDVDIIKSMGLKTTSARTRVMLVDIHGKEHGEVDLNTCQVELLPNG